MSDQESEPLIQEDESLELPSIDNHPEEDEPTSQAPSNSDPDPLELRKLSLSYDYLMYKINDYINTLTEQTYQSILSKQYQINQEYLNDQLNLFDSYDKIEDLIKTVNNLEMEFLKLDQLEEFILDFKQRLSVLENEFGRL
ncbi:Biogenesis of lysosome-related organelles complex 1 subunit CNL1 [Candida viswanathii]|uniref:Biogenesis of lysosome-related organelles complex 1 subunit CNL1 n=1 Tax=Candida viswanathii TaxID=5486 RepID=A0A367XSV3_9ASCO|nr:Biogenesis of lysosome-related organelles complex 1 subunit CNL1 [Candida viswanathii]